MSDGLLVSVGPGLAFCFDLADDLLRRVERFLAYFTRPDAPPASEPIGIGSEAPPAEVDAGDVVLEEPPLIVRRSGALTLFELPRVWAWCDAGRGRAGIQAHQAPAAELDLFVGLTLAPMLLELAPARGWLGVHAAAVAIDGTGILLPGPSGAGKSTIFAGVHRTGHGVLSDDLVWLRPAAQGTTMHAFPRGGDAMPGPTADAAPLGVIVCPTIVDRTRSRLLPLDFAPTLEVLVDQGGFLSAGAPAGERFRTLVRIARSIPAYRLEAGRRRMEAPSLLDELSASLRSASK